MSDASGGEAFLVVIPARYASTRFPGKALAMLQGKTVLQRCVERCLEAVPAALVIVATDDDRIGDHARSLGVDVEMTSSCCLTGTDRVAEVASRRAAEWYVNVQGDEPFLDPAALTAMIEAARAAPSDLKVINAYSPITSEAEFRSVTVPKVVVRSDGRLQYISRAAIPTTKALDFRWAHRQVGMYAFRASALEAFAELGHKGTFEELEDIEILRYLDLGIDVAMIEVDAPGIAIDTPEDLERATRHLEESGL